MDGLCLICSLGQHQTSGGTYWEFPQMVKKKAIAVLDGAQLSEGWIDIRMESHSYFGEENFQVLAAQTLFRKIANLFQVLATCITWFSVHPSKWYIIITRLKVVSFLFRELCGEPPYNGWANIHISRKLPWPVKDRLTICHALQKVICSTF